MLGQGFNGAIGEKEEGGPHNFQKNKGLAGESYTEANPNPPLDPRNLKRPWRTIKQAGGLRALLLCVCAECRVHHSTVHYPTRRHFVLSVSLPATSLVALCSLELPSSTLIREFGEFRCCSLYRVHSHASRAFCSADFVNLLVRPQARTHAAHTLDNQPPVFSTRTGDL